MNQATITNSYEETQKLASNLIKHLSNSRVLALYGDLGSGKTTFVQGLAKELGIRGKIISPTFIIMRSYKIPNEITSSIFYHVDLYRINNKNDIRDLGLIEFMNDPQNLIAIEWPEKIENLLPKNKIAIYFEYLDENQRKISIKFP